MDATPTVIEAQPRETGSSAARAVRQNNEVPCILYGKDTDPVPLKVPIPRMNKLIFGRQSPVIEVQMNGETWPCILKDFDLHPLTERPQHADFQVLREGRKVTLTVPIRFQGVPEGQKNGGDTQYIVREMTISVLPSNIPAEIEVDVTDLEIGDSIHVYDLDVDYDIKMAQQQTLVTVVAPHLEPVLVEEEEAEELAEEEEEIAEEGEMAEETEEGEGGPQPGQAPGEVPPEA